MGDTNFTDAMKMSGAALAGSALVSAWLGGPVASFSLATSALTQGFTIQTLMDSWTQHEADWYNDYNQIKDATDAMAMAKKELMWGLGWTLASTTAVATTVLYFSGGRNAREAVSIAAGGAAAMGGYMYSQL